MTRLRGVGFLIIEHSDCLMARFVARHTKPSGHPPVHPPYGLRNKDGGLRRPPGL